MTCRDTMQSKISYLAPILTKILFVYFYSLFSLKKGHLRFFRPDFFLSINIDKQDNNIMKRHFFCVWASMCFYLQDVPLNIT